MTRKIRNIWHPEQNFGGHWDRALLKYKKPELPRKPGRMESLCQGTIQNVVEGPSHVSTRIYIRSTDIIL
jgi:hypothetical protein